MHVVVHTIPIKPDSLEVAKSFFETKFPPIAGQFTKWRGASLFATDDNQLISVGKWADEGQMNQFLSDPALKEAMASFSDLFAGPPITFITEQIAEIGPAK